MARRRMIDPNIWEDPSFNKLTFKARLLFIGMISHADDEGFIRGDAGSLKRLIFGFDEITRDEIEECIAEIVKKCDNIHFYEVKGEAYAHFTKWSDYQNIRGDRLQTTKYPKHAQCGQPADIVRADDGQIGRAS